MGALLVESSSAGPAEVQGLGEQGGMSSVLPAEFEVSDGHVDLYRRVGQRVHLRFLGLVAIPFLLCFLCWYWYLRVGNHIVGELGRSAQSFEVQGTFFGASIRTELQLSGGATALVSRGVVGAEGPATGSVRRSKSKSKTAATERAVLNAEQKTFQQADAEDSTELHLSDGDFALVSRDADVGGFGPAAGNGRKSISKSKAAASKSRRREWQAFFASLPVHDPPYTKREQNQFFKELEAAFLSTDRDGDGSISFSEFEGATKLQTPSEDRDEDLFREVDLNRDGMLGFGEILELEISG